MTYSELYQKAKQHPAAHVPTAKIQAWLQQGYTVESHVIGRCGTVIETSSDCSYVVLQPFSDAQRNRRQCNITWFDVGDPVELLVLRKAKKVMLRTPTWAVDYMLTSSAVVPASVLRSYQAWIKRQTAASST